MEAPFRNNRRASRMAMTLLVVLCILQGCREKIVVTKSNGFASVFGDGNEHSLEKVLQLADCNYLVCGTVNSGMHGLCDGYLMKVDDNFNVLWYKNYGGTNQDFFKSAAIDEQGNIMAAGNSYSFGVSVDSSVRVRSNLFYLVYTDA